MPVQLSCLVVSNSFVTPWTVAYPTPLFMEFSRKYWRVGCHFLLQGIFLTQGLNICLLHWQADSLPMSHQRSPVYILLLFSCSVMSDSVWPHGLQHARLPCPSTISQSLLKLMSIGLVMPSNHLILCCPLSPPAFSLSQHQSFPMSRLFTSGGQSIGVSASASVLSVNIQDWYPLGWQVWSPCSPRDSQESSPTPQFKSISSSALSLLYSPTLTFIHDYWKDHSLD